MMATVHGETVVHWDFTQGDHGWTGNPRVADMTTGPQGLSFRTTGEDPWITSPEVEFPAGAPLKLTLRIRSSADPMAEIFYDETPGAPQSRQFVLPADGQWHEPAVYLPPLRPTQHIRIDPCNGEGNLEIAWVRIEALSDLGEPQLRAPNGLDPGASPQARLVAGPLELVHYAGRWGDFALKVDGREMAHGHDATRLGIMREDEPIWIDLDQFPLEFVSDAGRAVAAVRFTDPDGVDWTLVRQFTAGDPAAGKEGGGQIQVTLRVEVSKPRQVFHLPVLEVFPGLDSFGAVKHQGLLSGVEYLADEPSSSEKDVRGPGAERRIAAPRKFTQPLMAIEHEGRYVGLTWQPDEDVAAVFDSPDRLYGVDAHLLGLWAIAVGERRLENAVMPMSSVRLEPGQAYTFHASVLGGVGPTVLESLKHYVALAGIPEIPSYANGLPDAVRLLGRGWLDSEINVDGRFKHAYWPTYKNAHAVADAVVHMLWLAAHTDDAELAERLRGQAEQTLGLIPESAPYAATVGHVHLPTPPLVLGRLPRYLEHRAQEARALLGEFGDKGYVRYQPREGKPDYSETHFADHANGLAGQRIYRALEGATLVGEPELIEHALEVLDRISQVYDHTVPRGAQTWEIPLHTPDQLASAHLVHAYVLAWKLRGQAGDLERARYWGWSGMQMVYLIDPARPIGRYATIGVLGATNWSAPYWIGQPVQWVGLVYGSALHELADIDPEGIWRAVALGISATGLQMTFPLEDEERRGLLPDFFFLREQLSAGPAINPATVGARLPDLYGKGCLYDFEHLADPGWLLHAPCELTAQRSADGAVTIDLAGWPAGPYHLLIAGVDAAPATLQVAGGAGSEPGERPVAELYDAAARRLIVPLEGPAKLTLRPGGN